MSPAVEVNDSVDTADGDAQPAPAAARESCCAVSCILTRAAYSAQLTSSSACLPAPATRPFAMHTI